MSSYKLLAAEIAAWIIIIYWEIKWLASTFAEDGINGGWRWQLDLYFARIEWAYPNSGYFFRPEHVTVADIHYVTYEGWMIIVAFVIKLIILIVGTIAIPLVILEARNWFRRNIENTSNKRLVQVLATWILITAGTYAWVVYTLNYTEWNWRYIIDMGFAYTGLVDRALVWDYGVWSLEYGFFTYCLSSLIKWAVFITIWVLMVCAADDICKRIGDVPPMEDIRQCGH